MQVPTRHYVVSHITNGKECEKSRIQARRQSGSWCYVETAGPGKRKTVKAHSKTFCYIFTYFHIHTHFSTLLLPYG